MALQVKNITAVLNSQPVVELYPLLASDDRIKENQDRQINTPGRRNFYRPRSEISTREQDGTENTKWVTKETDARLDVQSYRGFTVL